MSNNIETVSLIKIEIDASVIDTSKKKVLELTDQIGKLKEAQKANTRETDEQKAAYVENQAQIAALTKERKQNNEVLKQANTIANTAKGSNEQLRASLSAQTAAYNKLSEAERNNEQVGGKLRDNIKKISDELKKNESAIGDNRRNVGNYKEAFGGLLDTFKSAGGPIGGAVAGFQSFNTTLAANPIGAVVQLIAALVNALKGNAEVADFVTRATAGLNKAFQFLTDAAVSLIKPMKAVFENPKKAIVDLVDLIKNNLINRFKALGVIVDAIANRDMKALTNGLLQLGTGVENSIDKVQSFGKALIDAGSEGFAASKKMDEFTVSQARMAAQMKLNEKQIAALERDLKNVGLTFQERKKIAEELADLEIANARLAQQAAKEVLDAEQLKLKGKQLNAEEEAKLIELTTDVQLAAEDEKIAAAQRSKRIALLLKGEEAAEKKVIVDQELADRKKAEEEGNKFAEAESKRWTEQLKKDAAARTEAKKTALSDELNLIKERSELEELVAENSIRDEKELATKKKQIAVETLQFQLSALRTFFNESGVITEAQSLQLRKLEEQIKNLQNLISTPPANGPQTLGQSLGLTDDDIKKAQTNIQIIQAGIETVSQVLNAGYETQLNDLDKIKQQEIENVNNSVLSQEAKTKEIEKINKKFAKEQYEIQKKQFETNQVVQIAQAVANTAAAIIAQFANPTPYAGVALAALAAVTGAAQIAVIASQKPPPAPTFEQGGIVKAARGARFGIFGGKSHANGGNKFVAEDGTVIETEKDELWAIVNKRSTNMLRQLSDLNQLGGGVAFARGGIVDKYAGGGTVASIANAAFQQADNTTNLAAQLSAVVPVLVVEEFESVQGMKVRAALNLEV